MKREIKFRAWDKEAETLVYSKIEPFDNPFDFWSGYDTKRYDWMQFTGLKDKSGVEIYEGDIVVWGNLGVEGTGERHIHQIVWNETQCVGFALQDGVYFAGILERDIENLEVIGNIYETPELLTNK